MLRTVVLLAAGARGASRAACYARRYPDLAHFCGGDGACDVRRAKAHYRAHGRREGRTFGCDDANPEPPAAWCEPGRCHDPKAVWHPLSTAPELAPGRRVRAELVVAKCAKPVDWVALEIETLKAQGVDVDRVTVYAKCGHATNSRHTSSKGVFVETRVVPNTGRCDETYARHLRDNYDNLRDLVLFAKDTSHSRQRKRNIGLVSAARVAAVRGVGCGLKPFETDWALMTQLRNWTIPFYRKAWSGTSGADFTSPYPQFGAWLGAVLDAGVATATPAQLSHLAQVRKARVVPVCFGGTFAAARASIHSVPRATWAFVAASLHRGDSVQEGHYAERAWALLLGPDAPLVLQAWLACRADAVVRPRRRRAPYCAIRGMLVHRGGNIQTCATARADADIPGKSCLGQRHKVTDTLVL